MKLHWSFQRRGGRVQPYNRIMSGGVWIGYFNTIPEKTVRDLKGFYVNLFPKQRANQQKTSGKPVFQGFSDAIVAMC